MVLMPLWCPLLTTYMQRFAWRPSRRASMCTAKNLSIPYGAIGTVREVHGSDSTSGLSWLTRSTRPQETPPVPETGIGIFGSDLQLIDPTILTMRRTIGAVGGISVAHASAIWPATIWIPPFEHSTSEPPPTSKPVRPNSLMRQYLQAPSITTNFPLVEIDHPSQ